MWNGGGGSAYALIFASVNMEKVSVFLWTLNNPPHCLVMISSVCLGIKWEAFDCFPSSETRDFVSIAFTELWHLLR